MNLTTVACPYCYHRIDGRRLWYQCLGHGSPGKDGCKKVNDPDRARETGVNEQQLPAFAPVGRMPISAPQAVCAACGGRTGKRVCPCCHTPLSPNFGSARSPMIAVVGAKGTGKSIYLNVLAHQLTKGMGKRFSADVRLSDASSTVNLDQVFQRSTLLAQTAQATAGRREPVVFEWRYEHMIAGLRKRLRTSFLSFYDTAGEDLESHLADDQAYLGAADALIILLDPFLIERARDQVNLPVEAIRSQAETVNVISGVTDALRASKAVRSHQKVKIPVAVAFAKIDAFFGVLGPDHPLTRRPDVPLMPGYDEPAGQTIHENVRALLHDWDADQIDAHMQLNYTNFRYFAVSALGAEPDYAAATVDPHGIQPFRVDEPLVWLLSHFGVVSRRGVR